jgi:hypothetical protein
LSEQLIFLIFTPNHSVQLVFPVWQNLSSAGSSAVVRLRLEWPKSQIIAVLVDQPAVSCNSRSRGKDGEMVIPG